ncbi:hypothetical protein FGIG_05272 [Fasciola gigantica]|uniref:Uncharacterized protein n=1 Tax=Fasciola gigantica TaxID=46835 RepID=A0A504ZCI4_FASGI|nr:hypothetical protein FGIG_05272 [Fasciola gigantica]
MCVIRVQIKWRIYNGSTAKNYQFLLVVKVKTTNRLVNASQTIILNEVAFEPPLLLLNTIPNQLR